MLIDGMKLKVGTGHGARSLDLRMEVKGMSEEREGEEIGGPTGIGVGPAGPTLAHLATKFDEC